MNKTSLMIKKLLWLGVSKYTIAKECGVTWQTVYMWEKGAFAPRVESVTKLAELLAKSEQNPGKSRREKLLEKLAELEEEAEELGLSITSLQSDTTERREYED